jgi:hypothetical protein
MLNGVITVLVITLRFAWPALIVLAVLASLGFLGAAGHRFPPLRSFAALFVPFLLLCIWGGSNWAAEELADSARWRSTVLTVLACLSLVLLVAIPVIFRRAPRWWLLIPASLASLVLTLGAWFVGSMAISNTWL